MNNLPNLSMEQQQNLIRLASEKLGMSTEQITAMIQSGSAEGIASKAGIPVQQYLSNPAAIEKLLSDPKSAAIIKRLIGGK